MANKLPAGFPIPDASALMHSQKVLEIVKADIVANKGCITFARYMELVLYTPGLGYYDANLPKLGSAGDFVTAPEVSSLFSRCLAHQCQQIIELLDGNSCLMELGAGTGQMAADILLELEYHNALPERYLILEISADLRQRQQKMLAGRVPHLFERITWLEQLPAAPLRGVILANEVLDAMPVHRFQFNTTGLHEIYVGWKEGKLVWHLDKPSSEELVKRVNQLGLPDTEAYESEINLMLPAWLKSIGTCLQQGLILLIDYGFPRHEYYHPDRYMGTLMCHYRHRAHGDPFILAGLQDITTHVDFTAVAESAVVAAGLTVSGYSTQAAFLLNCGLLNLTSSPIDNTVRNPFVRSQQIQTLTSPSEMGELFKVIALTRAMEERLDKPLLGFTWQDQRGRL